MKIILFFIFILTPSALFAKNTSWFEIKPFTSMCESDNAIGFLLKNNSYIEGEFIQQKFIAKKFNDSEADCWFNDMEQKKCMCGDVGQYSFAKFKSGDEMTSTRACYEIKQFGTSSRDIVIT